MNVVYKTIPVHTEENVTLDQALEIYFMIDMNKNTFRPENIILFNVTEQVVEPVDFEYNRRVLKVKSVSNLKAKNRYQLQLVGGEKGLKDITGRMMADTYELEFFTKDIESLKPPVILSPTDVSVVSKAATFELEPNLEVDYYELQISKSNTFQNLEWPTNGEKVYRTSEVSVTPDVPYATGLYYMRVRSVGFDGQISAWSDSIRFFYDGAPIIHEPEDPQMPDEIVTETPTEGEVVVPQARKVILQAMSQLQETNQLSKLQDVFSAKAGETLTSFTVRSATPKDKSVNNNVVTFNNMVATGNRKKIIVEFSENIDPATVNPDGKALTAYVLSERN
jgi:hypothetical protein